MLRNVKDDKTFLSAKFQFSVIQFVKVISNKLFFLIKALNPGLKLLEIILAKLWRGRGRGESAPFPSFSKHESMQILSWCKSNTTGSPLLKGEVSRKFAVISKPKNVSPVSRNNEIIVKFVINYHPSAIKLSITASGKRQSRS